jgi:hypothetical protein
VTALLAIDPGTTHSGWVFMRDGRPVECGISDNGEVLDMLRNCVDPVAIERFEARGMPVGDESVETVLWTGRFIQAAIRCRWTRLVKRSAVKSYLCGTQKAKDSNVRQALIDRWGGKAAAIGNIKAPGPLYAVKSHAWQALGVAVTALETKP